MSGRRGSSLLGVLTFVLVALTLALAVAGIAHSHLNLSLKLSNRQRALQAAESAVALTIEQLLRGKAPEIVPFEREGVVGNVAFPPSVNNLRGDAPKEGVPAGAARLLAEGRCAGELRRLEVLIRIAEPDVLSSSGPVHTRGPVLVARVADTSRLEDLLPGDLASGSEDNNAVVLGEGAVVTGDAQAAGSVVVEQGAEVWGEARSGASRTALPELDLVSFDPEIQGRPMVQTLGDEKMDGETMAGFYVRRGDLHVEGQLDLQGAVLFVDGDLLVEGPLEGTGAIITLGSAKLNGAVALETDNQVALLAGSDVTMEGGSFTGLVYTEGDFTARGVTVVGTFAANSAQPEGSRVTLDEAEVFNVPGSSKVAFDVAAPVLGPDLLVDSIAFGFGHPTYFKAMGELSIASLAAKGQGWQQIESHDSKTCPGKHTGCTPGRVSVQVNIPSLEMRAVYQPEDGSDIIMQGSEEVPSSVEHHADLGEGSKTLYFALPDGTMLARVRATESEQHSEGEPQQGGSERWEVDLKEFLAPRDLLRVILWREL